MSTATFEIRGWHVLAAMLSFFAIIILVNVTFAVYAVRSFPGEDAQRSYLQGLHYNDTLAERREQAALGWSASTELQSDASGALLEVRLVQRDGAALDGAALDGSLQWRASTQLDRALTFQPAGDGRYVARIGELGPGVWRLRAHAQRGEQALDFESELTWRPSN